MYPSVAAGAVAAARAYQAAARRAFAAQAGPDGKSIDVRTGDVRDTVGVVLRSDVLAVAVGPTQMASGTTARSEHHDVALTVTVAAFRTLKDSTAVEDRAYELLAIVDRYVREQAPLLVDPDAPSVTPVEWARVESTDPATTDVMTKDNQYQGRVAAVVATVICRVLVRPA